MGKLVIGDIVSLLGANFNNYQSIPPNLQNEKTPPESWRKFNDWKHCNNQGVPPKMQVHFNKCLPPRMQGPFLL